MEIGLYGLPFSGKSVLFDLLTGLQDTGNKSETRVGSAIVPDTRLDQLAQWYESRKVTRIQLLLHDPGIGASEKKQDSLSNSRLTPVRDLNTLLLVVRCFDSNSVPHPEDRLDPASDLDMILTQFIVADLEVIERRLEKIEAMAKRLPKERREPYEAEIDLLRRIAATLESDNPWRPTPMTEAERKLVNSYALFHLKKFVVLGNLGDCSREADGKAWTSLQAAAARHGLPAVGINAQLELELREMDPEDAMEFRQSMNLDAESCRDVVRTLYGQLGLITFYTAGEQESAARPVPAGALAPQAAGTIHSDMERGFIRAEVFAFDDLQAADGSESKVKQSGAFRLEGKDYEMRDGDIVIIRFAA